MANVNALISLGIGSPADIPHFLLSGLSVVAAGDVSGVLSVTLADDTLVATGTAAGLSAINGELTQTLEDDACAATGTVAIVGVLDVTEDDDTLASNPEVDARLRLSKLDPDIEYSDRFFTASDFPFEVQVLDVDGDPENITGWAMSWVMKKKATMADANAAIKKVTANAGITISNAAEGICLVHVLAEDSAVTNGTYVHELKRTDAGSQRVLVRGLAVLRKGTHG